MDVKDSAAFYIRRDNKRETQHSHDLTDMMNAAGKFNINELQKLMPKIQIGKNLASKKRKQNTEATQPNHDTTSDSEVSFEEPRSGSESFHAASSKSDSF